MDVFTRVARAAGVDADSHVVLYDATPHSAGFLLSSRAWYTFKVRPMYTKATCIQAHHGCLSQTIFWENTS